MRASLAQRRLYVCSQKAFAGENRVCKLQRRKRTLFASLLFSCRKIKQECVLILHVSRQTFRFFERFRKKACYTDSIQNEVWVTAMIALLSKLKGKKRSCASWFVGYGFFIVDWSALYIQRESDVFLFMFTAIMQQYCRIPEMWWVGPFELFEPLLWTVQAVSCCLFLSSMVPPASGLEYKYR